MEIKCRYPRCGKLIEMPVDELFLGCPYCLAAFSAYGVDPKKYAEVEQMEEKHRANILFYMIAPLLIVAMVFSVCDILGIPVPRDLNSIRYSVGLALVSSFVVAWAAILIINKRVAELRKKLGIGRQ